MKLGKFSISPLDVLLVFVPISLVLRFALGEGGDVWIFITSCLAVIPLAGWMGRATEHLAAHYGAGVGGLLNATFGNAAELIIAAIALAKGLPDVVKASLTGSIIGNILLVLGLSLLLGGVKHRRQQFNPTGAGHGSTLLALSAIGLVIPAVFHFLAQNAKEPHELDLSLAIAIVLFVTYVLSLVFSLKTHSHLFGGTSDHHHVEGSVWSKRKALSALLVATALVAVMAELLVGAVHHTAEAWGMSQVFVGVVLVAIIGNAAEHSTAVLMAMKNQMDLAIHIAIGSSMQVALLIAPLLVFMSYFIGPGPIGLDFTTMEVFGVVMSVAVVALVAHDGESHWMEGVLLLAVYVIMGIAFFYLPV